MANGPLCGTPILYSTKYSVQPPWPGHPECQGKTMKSTSVNRDWHFDHSLSLWTILFVLTALWSLLQWRLCRCVVESPEQRENVNFDRKLRIVQSFLRARCMKNGNSNGSVKWDDQIIWVNKDVKHVASLACMYLTLKKSCTGVYLGGTSQPYPIKGCLNVISEIFILQDCSVCFLKQL